MMILELLSIPRLQHEIRKDTKYHIVAVILLIKLLHLPGDDYHHILIHFGSWRRLLIAIVGCELLEVSALEEEIVEFTQSHQ